MKKYILNFLIGVTFANANYDSLKIANKNSINLLIGNQSLIEKFPNGTPKLKPDSLVTIHLEYAVQKLKGSNVENLNNTRLKNRLKNIRLLEKYINEKKYPKNITKHKYQPVFIDSKNRFCAVGFLIKESAGTKIANMINKKNKYNYIYEIKSKLLNDWMENSGFSLAELQMIQPAYCNGTENRTSYNAITEDTVIITHITVFCTSGQIDTVADTITLWNDLLPILKPKYDNSSKVKVGKIIRMELLDSSDNVLNYDSLVNESMMADKVEFFKRYQYVINDVIKGEGKTPDTTWTARYPVKIVSNSLTSEITEDTSPYFDKYYEFVLYETDTNITEFAPHPAKQGKIGLKEYPLLFASKQQIDDFVAILSFGPKNKNKIVKSGLGYELTFDNPGKKTVEIYSSKGELVFTKIIFGNEYFWMNHVSGIYHVRIR